MTRRFLVAVDASNIDDVLNLPRITINRRHATMQNVLTKHSYNNALKLKASRRTLSIDEFVDKSVCSMVKKSKVHYRRDSVCGV